MDYTFMFISILIFALQTLSFKEFNRSFMKNLASYFMFNFLYFNVVVLTFILLNTKPEGIHLQTAILAVAFGVLFVITILLYMKAMEEGPLSFSSLLFSFGILVPIICGVFLWNEGISAVQLVGLALLFLTFYMGSGTTGDSEHKVNLRWLVFCITALVGNGIIMALSKAHQMIMPGKEIKEFLILAFGTASLLSLLLFFRQRFVAGEKVSHLKNRTFVLLVLAAGITTAFGNQLALYLSARIPAVIQFPTVNGGVVFVSTIFSALVFKEKLSKRGIAGMLLGLVALVLLSVK